MQKNIPEMEELIRLIGKLPGLGKKSATRIALRLINNREQLKSLTNSLAAVYKNIQRCSICGLLKNKDRI
jgi:recombination protein RecR